MEHLKEFFIGGEWVTPNGVVTHDVVNPATEKPIATIAMGDAEDVNRAVEAAQRAFVDFSQTSRAERLDLLGKIISVYEARSADLSAAVTLEMGSPKWLSEAAQVPAGLGQFVQAAEALKTFEFEEQNGSTAVLYEPIGVCGLITPWNWPLLLIGSKVAPAIAAGCSMVLKPSENAPLNALIVAEILEEAGVPPGVFNLLNGDGPTVGVELSRHPGIDMISITGSTRAGIEVAKNAADTVKRVHQELGGKSANILLEDADFEDAIPRDIASMVANSGQSCNAGSRILVPASRLKEAEQVAARSVNQIVVGPPDEEGSVIGPVVSKPQFEKVQRLIQGALDDGAVAIAGGPGKPQGLETGYYVRPTVFTNVTNDMKIAREEIFGPVLTLIPYEDEDDAVRIANDTEYGLSGFVSSANLEHAREVARRIRTGMVHLNGAGLDGRSPFGGYKMSGNGREYGVYGLREFLELKAVFGYLD